MAPPGPPTHHGHLVQVAEAGGPAPAAQPHQQHRCSPHQHADEEADDDDQAGVEFGGGLRCGGETGTSLPPRHRRAQCPVSEHRGGSRGERGLKISSSSPTTTAIPHVTDLHPAPMSPPPMGDQTPPPWPGSRNTKVKGGHKGERGSSQHPPPRGGWGSPGGLWVLWGTRIPDPILQEQPPSGGSRGDLGLLPCPWPRAGLGGPCPHGAPLPSLALT